MNNYLLPIQTALSVTLLFSVCLYAMTRVHWIGPFPSKLILSMFVASLFAAMPETREIRTDLMACLLTGPTFPFITFLDFTVLYAVVYATRWASRA